MLKKLFCIALSAAFLLALCACEKEEKEPAAPSVDLEYYAGLGSIPECPYTLGTDVAAVKAELEAAASQDGEENDVVIYDVTEGERTVRIDNGQFLYYYEKSNESAGISYIVDLQTAYGFELGTVSLEVKDALAGYEPEETDLTEDDVFFLFGISNATGLRVNFDNIGILFVFQDNLLCATAIYNTTNWTL